MSMSITIPNQGVPKPLLVADRQDGCSSNNLVGGGGGASASAAANFHSKSPRSTEGPNSKKKLPIKKFSGLVKYKECLKNHAAAIGGSATDGCGEFMAGGEEGTLEALKCSACNCHRNFHRKIHMQQQEVAEMSGVVRMQRMYDLAAAAEEGGRRQEKKRFRTKFDGEQKEKMLRFAEKAGWKMQKADDEEVQRLCEEIGVKRKVLKVWMHNNKYQFANKSNTPSTSC